MEAGWYDDNFSSSTKIEVEAGFLDCIKQCYFVLKWTQKTYPTLNPILKGFNSPNFVHFIPSKQEHYDSNFKTIENNIITVEGIDVLDGTPLIDIKPYIKEFDDVKQSSSG